MANVRSLSLKIITDILDNDAYSNIVINKELTASDLNRLDSALLTNIVYGTIKNKMLLEFYLQPFIEKKKVKRWVKYLMLMTIYQLVFLDKIPDHAAINEAVKIAKKRGGMTLSKFVNAVLRNFQRTELRSLDELKSRKQYLSIKYSFPTEILDIFIHDYGFDEVENILLALNQSPNNTLRVNNYLSDIDYVKSELDKLEIDYSTGLLSKNCLHIKSGNIAHLNIYKEGLVSIQDESSMKAVEILDPTPNSTVLDACSAPGGKTTYLGEIMDNTGKIYAHDLYEHKIQLINNYKKRVGLTNIEASVNDALELTDTYEENTFDYILVDAPCSGLGVIKRKPEIKYTKSIDDINEIIRVQTEILNEVKNLLKPGGILVYSTCTINKAENENQVSNFLENNINFELVTDQHISGMMTILPMEYNSDGFFISKMIRNN